jgi:hypothetical protein
VAAIPKYKIHEQASQARRHAVFFFALRQRGAVLHSLFDGQQVLSSHFDIVRRIINTITVCDVDMVCIQIYVKAVDARPATLDVGDATVFVRDDTPSMLSLKFVRTATWTTR